MVSREDADPCSKCAGYGFMSVERGRRYGKTVIVAAPCDACSGLPMMVLLEPHKSNMWESKK